MPQEVHQEFLRGRTVSGDDVKANTRKKYIRSIAKILNDGNCSNVGCVDCPFCPDEDCLGVSALSYDKMQAGVRKKLMVFIHDNLHASDEELFLEMM